MDNKISLIEIDKFQSDIDGVESKISIRKTVVEIPNSIGNIKTKIGIEIKDITQKSKTERMETKIFIPNYCIDALIESLKMIKDVSKE